MAPQILQALELAFGIGRKNIARLGLKTASVMLLGSNLGVAAVSAQNLPPLGERLPLAGYYEPSGIAQIPDGRLIVVEDEKDTAISLLTFQDDLSFSGERLPLEMLSGTLFDDTKVGALDDLEAITIGKDGWVYAITSHSRTSKGKRFKEREKLVRFKVVGNRAVDFGLLRSLRDQMASVHESIAEAADIMDANDDNHLSIEGMAYDSARNRLLIGMRGPVIDRKSVVLAIPAPGSAFAGDSSGQLAPEPIFLDLDVGGIRAMAYDPKLEGFLIISRREKKEKKFKLWFWNGDEGQSPRRIRLESEIDLSKAEGVTPVRHNGTEHIMLVFDSGRKSKGRNGEYMLLSYDQLGLSQ